MFVCLFVCFCWLVQVNEQTELIGEATEQERDLGAFDPDFYYKQQTKQANNFAVCTNKQANKQITCFILFVQTNKINK